jgi:hypothetical protein
LPTFGRFRFCKYNIAHFKYINQALVKKLDIVADIFQQANFAKAFDKKKHFYSLEGEFRCIPNKIHHIYALFIFRNA